MHRRWTGPGVGLALLLIVAAGGRGLGQATLAADAHVNAALPSVNSGGISNMNVGGGYTGLVQFDLSMLPAGMTSGQISRAVLRLYVNRLDAPGTVNVQPFTGAWSEMGVTYQTLPATGGPTRSFGVMQAGAYVALDVTAQVQTWVTSPQSNFGLALTSNSAVVEFDSKENDLTGHAATLDVSLASQGAMGPAGPSGAVGPQGPVGATGSVGPTGPSGANGAAGPAGAVGPVGPPGVAGAVGAPGSVGPAGAAGSPGPAGPPGGLGATGATGPAGAVGPAGPAGIAGPPGTAGGAGAQGPTGPAGATGANGPGGPPGLTGATGADGLSGPAGPQGVAGPVGLSFMGPYASEDNYTLGAGVRYNGNDYVSLIFGNHGNTPDQSPAEWALFATDGAAGAVGSAGATGPVGAAGPVGAVGPEGLPGATGARGAQGPPVANYLGSYGPETSYAFSDAVSYNGSTYISLQGNNHGNTPDQVPAYWAVLAAQGATGAAGAVGVPGATGATGATGPVGATGLTGPPVTFLGEWLTGNNYATGAAVSYGGGSYVALTANSGREPDISPTYWGVLAAAGSPGVVGPAGETGMEGPTGYPGPAGAMGAAGPPGSIGPTGVSFRGGWSGNAAYGVGDAVTYAGASYVSTTTGNAGNVPASSPSQWGLLAAAGASGAPGPQGSVGPAGPNGAAGAAGVAGPAGAVGVNFRGAWGSGPNYAVGDAVTFAGSTYLATVANNAVEPDQNGSVWTVIAAAGAGGPSGAAGAPATVAVGTVTTGAAGSGASVVNSGSGSAAVLNFTIPQGAMGAAGSGNGGTGSVSVLGSMVHAVSYNALFYSVNSPNQSANETPEVLTWVPDGCTASALRVFSQQGATITVTLRVGTPGAMGDTGLVCRVATGGSCSVNGNVAVPAGGFIDFSVANSDSTAAGVWTALTCG